MNVLLLSVAALLIGSAVAEETKDVVESLAEEGRSSKTINLPAPDLTALTGGNGNDPLGQLLLAIGNVLGLFNDIPGLQELINQLDANGVTGIPAAILASIVALSAGKASFLGLLLKPLQIANQVLAIVGIALLGTYLVESEGDFTGLLRRSDDSADYYSYAAYEPQADDTSYYTNRIDGARSLGDTPIVQRLGTFVHKAIETYEQLNA